MIQFAPLVLPIISKIFDRVLPDEQSKREAQAALIELQQSGELKLLEVQLSAIVAEAKSADPWTSRARPSFLYVVYFYLLMAFPMGLLFAAEPAVAASTVEGVRGWLAAIPEEMWFLFGTGYLGYVGARSWDKGRIASAAERAGIR